MEIKNAVAVCLISLFSATLVALIARMLDSQAAAQLEPQLASIAEELQAIRKQGGIAAQSGALAQVESATDGIIVYYFHSNTRCPNCRSLEAQTEQTLKTDFAAQLSSGEVTWKVLNYEKPAGAALARKFEVGDPVLVLARMKDNRVQDCKRLDKSLGLAGDKAALAQYVRDELRQMLAAAEQPPAAPPADGPQIPSSPPAIPIPE